MVVAPAMMYDLEMVPLAKRKEDKLKVEEQKMLRKAKIMSASDDEYIRGTD